jgi:hypothetical protein
VIKYLAILFLLPIALLSVAQDDPANRPLAEKQIANLYNGTLIVRLKFNERSIAAYRDAGQEKLADRLEKENRLNNLQLMKAFLEEFNFCRILFINSSNSKSVIEHAPYIFLDGRLNIDSSIKLADNNFLFAEYGEAMSNDRMSDQSFVVRKTQESSSPAATSAIVILDSAFEQLREPFPYYANIGVIESFVNTSNGNGATSPEDSKQAQTDTSQKSNNGPEAAARVLPQKPEKHETPVSKNAKNIYAGAVRRLNHRFIEFFIQVLKKKGQKVSDDPAEWAVRNPNINTPKMLNEVNAELYKLEKHEKFEKPKGY